MLAEFFDSPARIRAIREGPSGPSIEEFANHLPNWLREDHRSPAYPIG